MRVINSRDVKLSDPKHGFCSHLGQGYGAPVDQANVMHYMGGTVLRDDMMWNIIETTAGVYKVGPSSGESRVDDIYTCLARHNALGRPIDFLPVFAYGNSLYTQDITNPAWRAHFADYVAATVQGLLNFGIPATRIYPSVWNEPNESLFGQGFESNGAAYGELCLAVRNRVRTINSNIRIVGGEAADGHWGGYRAWWQAMLSVPNCCDIISTHEYHAAYPAFEQPESLFMQTRDWMTWISQYMTPTQTFAITECGDPGDTHTVQDSLHRWISMLDSLPKLEFVTHYALRDQTEDFRYIDEPPSSFILRQKAWRFAALSGRRDVPA